MLIGGGDGFNLEGVEEISRITPNLICMKFVPSLQLFCLQKKYLSKMYKIAAISFSKMNVYEVMLLISLVCVSLATVLMVFELRTFGDFPNGFPWRTEEFLVK